MAAKETIMAFSQSEKIKTGLIWISQVLDILRGLDGLEKQGAERVIKALTGMITHEIQLSKKVAANDQWDDIDKIVEQALVMINSGVGPESVVHLTKALSKVTTIGQNSLEALEKNGLF